MGINLYIANSMKEIESGLEIENLRLEDSLEDFIWRNREILSSHIEIYVKLEPYDTVILTNHEVLELKYFSETLLDSKNIEALNFYREQGNSRNYVSIEEYLKFARELKRICEKAILLGKPLYSVGDW